ncbi:MAG: hypothetical protein JRG85_15355 [Deltaproteobacteria bacterium]|nr:hypothetical protein [Deltaproteobacteria bacterium]
MRALGSGLALGVALAALTACGKPPPIAEFGFLATRPDVVRPLVIKRGVQGEWCFTENLIATLLRPPWNARLADHGRAVRDALDGIPTANVLTHVDVRVRIEQYLLFQRICAVVQGDAGRVE